MSSTLKTLCHKKIDDLQDKSSSQIRKLSKGNAKMLLTYCDKFYKAGEQYFRDGDEELSYIMFNNYFQTMTLIQKTDDYKKDTRYYNLMMSIDKAKAAMNTFELLCSSLKTRYNNLNNRSPSLPVISKSETSVRVSETNGYYESDSSRICDTTIDVRDFLHLLMDRQIGVLVMDCRPREDFNESHITVPKCLNIPAEIVKPGMTAGTIQHNLSVDSKQMWASRSIKDHVILMDWSSVAGGIDRIIDTLKSILQDWDQDVTYRNPLRILNGGYENFLHTYPMHTSNPQFRPISSYAQLSKQVDIDDVEYPDINNIAMKDTIAIAPAAGVGSSRHIPKVDRTSKLEAIEIYSKQYETEAKLMDRTLAEAQELDKELEHAEAMPMELDSAESDDIQTKRIELNNKMIELTDRSESVDKHVNELRYLEQRPVDPVEDPEILNEVQRQIKEAERKQLQDQRKLAVLLEKKKERLEKLQNERVQPQAPVIVQRPIINRASKPTYATQQRDIADEVTTTDDEVIRYFQAVPGGEGHGLTGLKNLGNTCYMNSIMQCLSNTAMLREFFVSDEGYRKQVRRTSKTPLQIADEVSAVMREIWLKKHRHIASNDLRRVIGQCKQIFRGTEQQDSHEFLTILMDWLHLDLQFSLEPTYVDPVRTPAEEEWHKFANGNESYIMKLFYGQIKSTVKCRECKMESATFEGFSNLSLELPEHGNRCDITDCLNMYFYGENISGWNCPKCKQKRDAIKKLDISKLPPILVIHLKRFNVDLHSSTTTYKKKTNYVHFPHTDFDMSPYIAPSERQTQRVKNTTFELYGVSNHYGEMNRGHYTAFCKSSYYNKWYKFDDHNVSRMDPNDVPSSAAYILFYATPSKR